MASMDIFNEDAFGTVELTAAFENLPYRPSMIRSMGLFTFKAIRQRQFAIEWRNGVLELIPFGDPDAGPIPTDRSGEGRRIRDFRTRHFSKDNTIQASEVAGIRAFGEESELQQVQTEVAARALRLRNEGEMTFEYHMLNALDGIVKDPKSGITVYDWYAEFGIARPDAIDLDLDNGAPAAGALKKKCLAIRDHIEDGLGDVPGEVTIEALCGRNFWRDLTTNKEVIDAYKAQGTVDQIKGQETGVFSWGDITWRRYRPGASVSVPTDECRFYVSGVPGLFEQYASPAEDFQFVNTPGMEFYYRLIQDRDRNKWVKPEIEANPMFVCTRPKALLRGTRT